MSNPTIQKNQLELIKDILKTHTILPKTGSFSNPSLKLGANRIYEQLSKTFSFVEELGTFTACFSQDNFDSFETKNERLFVLKEIRRESHLLPVVGVKYRIGEEHLSVSLRVGLYQNNEKKIKAFGYRFECPSKYDHKDAEKNKVEESSLKEKTAAVPIPANSSSKAGSPNKTTSSHDFFHAQPIRAFKKDDKRYKLRECPDWFSDKQPSFPLDAKCPVTLTLAFLISLYGMTCWDEIAANQRLGKKVKTIIKDLHLTPLNNLN